MCYFVLESLIMGNMLYNKGQKKSYKQSFDIEKYKEEERQIQIYKYSERGSLHLSCLV